MKKILFGCVAACILVVSLFGDDSWRSGTKKVVEKRVLNDYRRFGVDFPARYSKTKTKEILALPDGSLVLISEFQLVAEDGTFVVTDEQEFNEFKEGEFLTSTDWHVD